MRNMPILFCLLAFTGLPALFSSPATNPEKTTESRKSVRYDTLYVNADIMIADRDSLIINPGTVIMFVGHYSIHVQGKLIANGTQSDSIIFTVNDTTGFSNIYSPAGGWNGILFENTHPDNDSSLFAYCRFEFGKAIGDSVNSLGGAVRVDDFSKVRFSNSAFYHNYSFTRGAGIHGYKSDIIIEHCHFEKNYSGNDLPELYGYGAGMNFVSANPTIRHCTFINNESTGIGGGISFEFSNPEMINCIFTGNHSALGGAIGFLRCAPDRTIANMLVNNNTATFFGGGIANITGSPRLSNFTIVNNHAAMGGGYYCNEWAHPQLFNSILWGNTGAEPNNPDGSQVWIWDVYSEPGFYNCAVQYGPEAFGGSMFIGEYQNCIESNPLFSNTGDYDFTLIEGSPCINAGTPDTTGLMLPDFDLLMNPRIIHGIIDMGAYEYDGPFGGLIPGDANCDGLVNVSDVISQVNYIMNLNPQPFCFDNADVNGDGVINVTDVTETINLIMAGN
jgi:hypothetical protein